MSSSASVKLRYEKCLQVWGNAKDVLARRWRALFLDARVALAIAPRVAEIITEETGQEADLLNFQKLCQQYVLKDRRV